MTYDRFFEQATGRSPYPFQRALAMADELPEALIAPTGAGKTAAAILAWLYRRRFAAETVRQATPRRLVFCLPMRTLVSQAAESARTWLSKLELLDEGRGLKRAHGVSVATLLGGEVDDDWYLHPERDAVIVGTQDMLLSRALNRGYASSRFHWPWDFALLSNDCLWIFDEVQLMGVGLTTALQLAGLRSALGAYGSCGSLFMSATLDTAWLTTIDHPEAGGVLPLSSADLDHPDLSRRRTAPKRLSRMEMPLGRDWVRRVGRLVRDRHIAGTRTLVVVNSVDRAVDLFAEVQNGAKTESVLLHSRFRPPDRERALRQALAHGFDGIVVSTQVIEAGVDISSRTLFTELAPWTSMVQRAGRCNRAGEFAEADIVWLDSEVDTKSALPYLPEALAGARAHLEGLTSFNPEAIEGAAVHLQPPDVTQVLRRRDLEDLFDTTPDLAGYDIDVSRFIRDGEERDVQVFWRATSDAPSPQEPRAQRDELCAVPFLRFREWLMKHRGRAWRWDHLEGAWDEARPDRVVPGAVFLVDAQAGGYQPTIGWAADSDRPVASLLPARPDERPEPEPALDDDRLSELSRWVTLRQHSLDTRDAAREIVGMLSFHDLPDDVLVRAAHAHDLGKAHQVFQDTMRRTGGSSDNLWAKSGGRFIPARMLNELVYCPRLFYLEHVAGEWEESADTVAGKRVHRRVDAKSSTLPAPTELPGDVKARSVTVSSETEGIIAKLDLIEAVDGAVTPVDYKRGAAPDPTRVAGGVWPADRVQMGAQLLALRDSGYQCNEAVVYYAASKTRVHVPFDVALESEVRAAVVEARRLTAARVPPPPLVDSPKCPGCSLVGICLPDETNVLLGARADGIAARPPRRLIPSHDDRHPCHVQAAGATVGKAGDVLEVRFRDGTKQEVRTRDVSHLSLFGRVQVTAAALQELCSRDVGVSFFTAGGWYYGTLAPHSGVNVQTRIAQFRLASSPSGSLPIARAFVMGKIQNCRTLLRRNARERPHLALGQLKRLAQEAERAQSHESLLGVEGSAARAYFQAFPAMLSESATAQSGFDFEGRNRRPPRDPVNALLSFGYSLLARECHAALVKVGFDPSVGFLHQVRPGRPALALDLMEEFRPLVADSVVLSLLNTAAVQAGDFVAAAGGIALNESGRRAFLSAFERRMSQEVTHAVFEYRISYRRILEVQARLLARVTVGELSAYRSFQTR